MFPNDIVWPLDINVIRRNSPNNAFGMVRNHHQRAHQGWDLLAYPGTPCYAISDGEVVRTYIDGDYGNYIILKFEHRGQTRFAVYAHLSIVVARNRERVAAGELIGLTGTTGNAHGLKGDDQHLHFEIRTIEHPGHKLNGRLDPKDIYGYVPLHSPIYDSRHNHGMSQSRTSPPSGVGLKVRGVNVL